MRGEDRPSALAFLDQQAILRPMRRTPRAPAIRPSNVNNDRLARFGSFDWTRNQTPTATIGDRAIGYHTGRTELIECAGGSHC